MKMGYQRLLFVIVFITGVALTTNAQEVGVRFGGTNGAGGAAIDAVFGSGSGRIHADLGFYKDGLGVDVLWDLLYRPLNGEAFNWYLGVGPTTFIGGDNFWLGVSGEIGLEYRFSSVPIAIGADWRPTLWVVEETKFGADSFGLNIRFVF
jgi:hypothetical protein